MIGPADTASSRFLSADSLATNVRDEAASCFRAATRLAPLVPTILLELTFFDQRERRPVLGNVASAKELSQISAIRPHDFFCDHRCRGLTHGQCYKTWPAGSRRRRPRRSVGASVASSSFDDGRASEFNTLLVTDWFAHTPSNILAKNFGVPATAFNSIPLHDL